MKEINKNGKTMSDKNNYGSVYFKDVVVSNFGASKNGKKATEYECNMTGKAHAKVNKNLSVVEDYAEIELKNRSSSAKKVDLGAAKAEVTAREEQAKAESKAKSKAGVASSGAAMVATTAKTAKKSAACAANSKKSAVAKSSKNAISCKKCEKMAPKAANTHKNDVEQEEEIVENVKIVPSATIRVSDDALRHTGVAAPCGVMFDDAAEQIVKIARMGSLFDCVKNY